MEHNNPFGTALKYFRKNRRNLTQKKLGEVLGTSQAMISKIEKGRGVGSVKLREAITEYFNMSYSDFIEAGRQELAPEQNDNRIEQLHAEVEYLKDTFSKHFRMKVPPLKNDITTHKRKKIAEHIQVIGEFKDYEKALEINKGLVELEAHAPDELEEINALIKAKLQRYRKKQGSTEREQKKNTGE